MKPTRTTKRALLALAAVMPCAVQAAQIDVITTQTVNTTAFGTNVDAITANTTWTKDNVYILSDKVFVAPGVTLTIEPGTRIYSTFDDNGTPADKADDAFGALVITRGADINAAGTAEEPIVFTTIDELEAETQTDLDGDSVVAEAPTATTVGRWGGVVILGSAPVANYSGAVNIGEDRIEGFQPAASADLDLDTRADVIEYGGANAADSSGVFSYVSIRHGGYVFSGANEINGLTLGGVGSGTQIDHVEIFANSDDGFEFFGGTVNTSHLVAAFCQDDSFDIDQGYSGTNQFWFSIQTPFLADGVGNGRDRGGEWDGVTGTIGDYSNNSAPVIYNATFIGSGRTAPQPATANHAIFLDDRFKGKIYNSVFDDYAGDLVTGDATDGPGTGLVFSHNTVGRFGGGTPGSNLTYVANSAGTGTFFDASGVAINGNSNGGVDPKYTSYTRDAGNLLSNIDPRPAIDSPLLASNGATLQTGAPVATNFRGAFGTENWAAGWTRLDEASYLSKKVDVIASQTVNTTAFGTNVDAITTNTTWTKDNIYILNDKVFVAPGVTLTIEPGTRIYSTFDDNGSPSDKADDAFGALVITRGADINAAGTAEEPIVFTTIDELEAETQTDFDGDGIVAEAPTATTVGRWGGVVILGSAPVANYSGAVNIGEDRIEGFQPAASADLDLDTRADVIEYGGANAADSSGVFSYVSIRHGGYVFSGANEINGLTLGGVGSGTQIDHVEIFANSDDGFEFFGGTVNTSHLVAAFCQDDSFDIDQGYSGTNQFWFSIQTPFLADGVGNGRDRGGEWDGVTGTIGDYSNNSAPVIYNATFIGSGRTAPQPATANNAIFLDDRFKGKLYNSVIDDFTGDLITGDATDGPGTGIQFAHNTVGRFGGGSYSGSNASNLSYVANSAGTGTFFSAGGAPINGNSNGGVDPQYRNYVRDASNTLVSIDPRPASGSPLLSSSLQPGAPEAVSFRGAFGSENWAAGWTRLSFSGELQGEAPATGGSGEPPFADVDGDGIDDALEASPALAALGFIVGNDDSALFSSIYTEAAIQDLVTDSQVMIEAAGGNVNLTLPVFKSDNLGGWTPAGDLQLTIPQEGDKQFYRIEVNGAN